MRTEPNYKDIDAIINGLFEEGGTRHGEEFVHALDKLDPSVHEWIVHYVIKRWSKRCTQSGLFGEIKG